MGITVHFREVGSDVVIWEYRPAFRGDGYDIVENGISGEIEVSVEGECLVAIGPDERVVLRDSSAEFELFAGKLMVFARPGVELPDWNEIRREFNSSL